MMGAALATGVAGSLPARLALAAPKGGAPWRLLFNGVDLTGWNFFQEGVGETDRLGAVAIEDGVLRLQGPAYEPQGETGFGHLATAESFSNFHLRLDFKWGGRRFAPRSLAKRNSGILYHMAPSKGVLYPDCIEFQVEETDVGDAILINVQGLEASAWEAHQSGRTTRRSCPGHIPNHRSSQVSHASGFTRPAISKSATGGTPSTSSPSRTRPRTW
jgi:hypothetical protein